ncbi:MAG: hypothetical protein WD136_07115 [Cyanobium sp.]
MSTQLSAKDLSNNTNQSLSQGSSWVRDRQGEGISLSASFTTKIQADHQTTNQKTSSEREQDILLSNEKPIHEKFINDKLTGLFFDSSGLESNSSIFTDDGNGLPKNIGALTSLHNNNFIYNGKGSAAVNIRRNSFDQVIGFDRRSIDGGSGQDGLFLKKGTYEIEKKIDRKNDALCYIITNQKGRSMTTFNFEFIGSSRSFEEVNFRAGTLVIGADGSVDYL